MTLEVGTPGDTSTEGTDYATVDDLSLTIPANRISNTGRFALTPVNDRIDEPDKSLTVTGSTTASRLVLSVREGLRIVGREEQRAGR